MRKRFLFTAAMTALATFVVLVDAWATHRWPAVDMGGIVAKLMLAALTAIEVVPALGFGGLALFAKSPRGGGRRSLGIIVTTTAVLLPVVVLGGWIGLGVLDQWGW